MKKETEWAERLSMLAGIPIDEAVMIAKEKVEYSRAKIQSLREKQYKLYVEERAHLIDSLENKDPLEPVQNETHARRILDARIRHKEYNYDKVLAKAKVMAKNGNFAWDKVQEYARKNKKKLKK